MIRRKFVEEALTANAPTDFPAGAFLIALPIFTA